MKSLSAWVIRKNLAFQVISIGMTVMLLWAGAFKMTTPGANGIIPLVTHDPLISLFKDIISLGACLFLISYFGKKIKE